MSDGPEPDAWATFSNTYGVMDDLDADREYLIIDEGYHPSPLFSFGNIKNGIRQILLEVDEELDDDITQFADRVESKVEEKFGVEKDE